MKIIFSTLAFNEFIVLRGFLRSSILSFFLVIGNLVQVNCQNPWSGSIVISHETEQGKSDGQVRIGVERQYSIDYISYDYHGVGNHQKTNYFSNHKRSVLVDSLPPGKYFNFAFVLSNGLRISVADSFRIQAGRQLRETKTERAICGSINFTDCNGNSITRSGLETSKAYNIDNSVSSPCGFEVSNSCSVVNKSKWQCINGNLSAPASYTDHVISNYAGVGLSSLTAARLAWIICSYPNGPSSDSDPIALAVWYLTGTGGSQNSIYNAAVAAVPAANGSENGLVFYKRKYSTNQDFVKWQCNPCTDFSALAVSSSNLVKSRQVSNEVVCGGSNVNRVFYTDCLTSSDSDNYRLASGGTFNEYCDGTAILTMVIENPNNVNQRFNVTALFSGRTYTAPSGSPHLDGCTSSASSNWYYYTSVRGTLVGLNDYAGAVIAFRQKMAAFQLGTNASLWQSTTGAFGGSGWLDYTILMQPNNLTFTGGCSMDFNFYLSGGDLTQTQSSVCGSVCAGQQTSLNAYSGGGKPGYNYSWSNGLGSTQTVNVNPTITTTYTVTITDVNGCTATDQTVVNINPALTVDAGANATLCNGQSIVLSASASGGTPAYTYSWSDGLANGATRNPATTTTYTVTVTDSKGCMATDVVTLTVGGTLNLNATGATICAGATATISASATGGTSPYSYTWNGTLGTGATKTVTPAATTIYTVTVTDLNGCTKSANATVTVNPNPTAGATNDGPLTCTKTSVTLTATGGGTYAWSGGGTGSTKVVTTPGTYTVTVTNTSGCSATASTTVIQNSTVPTANAGSDVTITCATAQSATLTATGGGSYSWNTGATTSSITVSPAVTTTYTVTVTASNGCTASDAVIVTVDKTPPVASVTNDGPLTCLKSSVVMTANPATGVTYAWSGGGTARTKTVTTAGTYTVTVTNTSNGCTATATTTVTLDQTVPNATADNVGGPLTCIDNSVTIRAFPNDPALYTYSWGGPSAYTSNLANNNVSVAGIYTVTVTNIATGCFAIATTTVNQDLTPPTAGASNDGPLTCTKTTVTLTALPGSGVTYAWTGGGTSQTKIVTVPGTYTVTVTNITNGCTATASTIVNQNSTPPSAGATNDGPLTCLKTSVTLTATPASGVTYSWSGGGNAQTKVVTAAGTYTVTVTDPVTGCTAMASTTVLENVAQPNATADNIGGPLMCKTPSVTIRAFPDVATYTYAWSGPNGYTSTSRTNSVTVAGTYTVTVTDTQNGCSKTASTAVLQDYTVPTADAGPDKAVCNGTGTTLTATGSGTFLWSTGATTATISVSPAITTTYTVTVTGANGCTASDQAVVTVNALPSSGITGPNEICAEEYAVFNASPAVAGATYAWTYDGGTSLDGDANDVTESVKWATAFYGTTRTVTLTVTKDNCTSQYTKTIIIKQPAYLNTQDVYPVCQGGTVQIGPNPNDPAAVNPGATFQWTPNLFLNNNLVAQPLSTPPFDVTYTLTATVNGCAVSKQITVDVNVNLNPIADAGLDKTICITESTQIGGAPTATPPPAGGFTISGVLWTVPPSGAITSTQSNPLVNPTTNTQYRVVVVASNGCTDTDFVNVTVTPKTKIGNYTWIDADADGCQDAGESGINGIAVTLYTSAGAQVATATTANDPISGTPGYYTFEVCPGTYYVNFGKPAGYAFTGEKVCAGTTTDSDANATTGNSMQFTIVSGQDNMTIDAGYQPLGNIRGNVTADTNNDNTGDTPLSGVTLQLKDAVSGVVVATTTTDAAGNYQFLNVLAGNYVIMETQPAGYNSVSDVDATPDPDGTDGATPNNVIPVVLTAGENDNDNNFVEEQPANIRGNVTADTDFDNVGDTPISGVVLSLVSDTNGNGVADAGEPVVATTTTDASGNYAFLNVTPGNYVVVETQPDAYNSSLSDVDATPDPDGNDGTTPNNIIPVTVTAGEADANNNFVEEQPANIRGNVTADTNNDNTGDTPLSNVTLSLVSDTNGNGVADAGEPVVATTTTDASGNYAFLNQSPGNYVVVETQPAGYNSVSDVDATPDPDGTDGATPNNVIPVVLTAGENDNDNNFVEEQPANIRGNVTVDTNGDNVGDTPISGVTLSLVSDTNGNGVADAGEPVLATTTTNASGNYEFLNRVPGNYVVVETQPVGYISVSDVDATPDPDGNDGATANEVIPVVLVANENDNDNNFVEKYNASLGDYVWHDLNANGIQDAGEPGIANVTVRLFNSGGSQIGFKITDPTGYYQFTNLAPGTYTVKFDTPAGYLPTGSDKGGNDTADSDANTTTGITDPITLAAGQNNPTIDAGYYRLASIGNFVWEDKNVNGIQDNLEPGIAGVNVTLTGTDVFGNAVNLTTTTDATGLYQFTGLVPGDYKVTFSSPGAQYKPTVKDTPADDAKDSDASTTTGETTVTNLTSGENDMTIDAGFYRCAQVGDYVWFDTDLNNIQTAPDFGLNGIQLELYNFANPATPVQTTVTTVDPRDGTKNGYYNFEVCTPGQYFIKVKADPNQYDFVQPNQGVNDAIDSDVIDFDNRNTLTFTVDYASVITDIDAGVKQKVLPVTMKEFTGWWNKSADVNELRWITASEQNNDHFVIERSFRASDFVPVGRVEGNGNSSTEKSYSFEDEEIALNGVYTYRLKQVDFDGKVVYSDLVDIEVGRDDVLRTSVWPNPSVGHVNIEVQSAEGTKVKADIFDGNGRLVKAGVINTVSIGNILNAGIEAGELSKGVYHIVLTINGKLSSHKLIILE